MLIRTAEFTDLGAIVEIYNQAIRAGQCTADTEVFSIAQRLDWFNAHTPDKYPLLLAIKNEKVIGYLTISAYREGRSAFLRTAEVSYYIHFQHHRQGVASQLMQRAIGLCPSLKITTLIAMLLGSNNGSIGLLKKFGFEEWGRMPKIAEFKDKRVDHLFFGRHITKHVDGQDS